MMVQPKRTGDWMQTYTGKQFWPLDPRPEDVSIVAIAHALSNQCRYAGHCETFYSVAEHSVLVASILPARLKLWGLLHDAAEAYLTDMIRPVKKNMPEYRAAEAVVMASVVARFGLDPVEEPDEVKEADNAVLLAEKASIMKKPPDAWQVTGRAADVNIVGYLPQMAKYKFIETFNEIMLERYS